MNLPRKGEPTEEGCGRDGSGPAAQQGDPARVAAAYTPRIMLPHTFCIQSKTNCRQQKIREGHRAKIREVRKNKEHV